MTWYVTKWFPFSFSCRSIRFFSSIYCGNLVLFLENLIILLGSPYDWVTWEFLALRLVHTEPPAVAQLHIRLPYPATDPKMLSALQLVSASVNQDCLYSAYLSFPSLGHWFALCPPFSFWIPKSYYLFFSFFSFLLVVRREWLLHISWAELEVVSLCKHEAHSIFLPQRFMLPPPLSGIYFLQKSKMACYTLCFGSLWQCLLGEVLCGHPYLKSIPTHYAASLKQEFFLALFFSGSHVPSKLLFSYCYTL